MPASALVRLPHPNISFRPHKHALRAGPPRPPLDLLRAPNALPERARIAIAQRDLRAHAARAEALRRGAEQARAEPAPAMRGQHAELQHVEAARGRRAREVVARVVVRGGEDADGRVGVRGGEGEQNDARGVREEAHEVRGARRRRSGVEFCLFVRGRLAYEGEGERRAYEELARGGDVGRGEGADGVAF
jgi:hypothetical protein